MTSIINIFMDAVLGKSLTISESIIFLLCIIIVFLIVIVCQLHNSNAKLYLLHKEITTERKESINNRKVQ